MMRHEKEKTIWLKNNFNMKLKFCLFIILTSAFTVNAQLSKFSYNGYVKDLISTYKLPSSSDRFYDNLVHARLNTRWYPTQSLTAALELRFRTYYGTTVEKIPYFLNQIKSKHEFTQLDWVIWNDKKSIGYGQVDRLWLDWNYKNLEVTAGRQRIAWGTSWVWNPIDIFNALNVLDFDYEERPGVDALRIQYYTGPVSKIEFSARPGKTKKGWIAAGLWSTNAWNYDFNLIAGIRENRWLVGGGWSGDILKAGFRGEILVSQKPELLPEYKNLYYLIRGTPLSAYDKPTLTFVLSGDYTFTNSFYIHTEILHNNNGVKKYAALYYPEAMKLGMLTPAAWSIYQEFSYDITPLIKGSIFGILNPNDKSRVLVPSVSYSIFTNWDLYLIGLFFKGDNLTEFGNYGSSIYLRVKWSF